MQVSTCNKCTYNRVLLVLHNEFTKAARMWKLLFVKEGARWKFWLRIGLQILKGLRRMD